MTEDVFEEEEQSQASSRRKLFVRIVLGVFLFGVSIGGAYAIGVNIGRGQAVDTGDSLPLAFSSERNGESAANPAASGPVDGAVVRFTREEEEELRQVGLSEDEIEEMRQQLMQATMGEQPNSGVGADASHPLEANNSTHLTGTIESVDDAVITLRTPAGPQQIATLAGTDITITRSGNIDDLSIGDHVIVETAPGPEEGILEAKSISSISDEA